MVDKLNAVDKVKVGDLFVNTWGYEQTNVDYYQVVRKTSKMVILKPINSNVVEDGFMQGKSYPLKNNFVKDADEIKKLTYEYSEDSGLTGNVYANFEYGSGQLFKGDSARCSWYA